MKEMIQILTAITIKNACRNVGLVKENQDVLSLPRVLFLLSCVLIAFQSSAIALGALSLGVVTYFLDEYFTLQKEKMVDAKTSETKQMRSEIDELQNRLGNIELGLNLRG